jgi:hypothetical protein
MNLTRPAPEPRLLRGLVEDLGLCEWRVLLDGPVPLTPPERWRLLLSWRVQRALLLAGGGKARLLAWHRARRGRKGRPEAPGQRESRIREGIQLFGDSQFIEPAVQAFSRLPIPMEDMLLPDTNLVGMGPRFTGYFVNATAAKRFIVLLWNPDPAKIMRAVWHECCHAWHSPVLGGPLESVIRRESRMVLAQQAGIPTALIDENAKWERLAEAFELTMVGPPVA